MSHLVVEPHLISDPEQLTDLMTTLELCWNPRRTRELTRVGDLVPLLEQRVQAQDISSLSGYEN